ncbi:MAG: 2-dehydropantoate 2-reductase [Pseudomonadota bacterium]|nr:MAG: 2-dehydropantoate 2-reductase [Pseudomonadota bacterium]
MKILIFGSGGVGGYFGGRLAASGEDVTFLARGEHLQALRQDGLYIQSALGDLHLRSVQATDDPASVGPVDLILVGVKLWDTEAAAKAIAPIVGPNTAVVSFQNGVDAVDVFTRALGRERVMGGIAHIAAVIERSGVIRHNGTMQRLTFGELDGSKSARTTALLAACRRAGIDVVISQDIQRVIWEKFVFIVGLSAMTTLTRLPIGAVRTDPDTRAMLLDVMQEAAAVGRAKGVNLPPEAADGQLNFMDGLPYDMIASMLGDLNRGRRLELPWLSGAVTRLGEPLGVATPVNKFVYAALKLHADGRRADAVSQPAQVSARP